MKKNNLGFADCEICGKTFKLFQRSKKTCSGRCARALALQKPPKVFVEKNTGFFEWDNYPNGIFLNPDNYVTNRRI